MAGHLVAVNYCTKGSNDINGHKKLTRKSRN